MVIKTNFGEMRMLQPREMLALPDRKLVYIVCGNEASPRLMTNVSSRSRALMAHDVGDGYTAYGVPVVDPGMEDEERYE